MWPLYLPLIIPALAGAAARPVAFRLDPRQATWLLTSAAVALAAYSTAALALLGRVLWIFVAGSCRSVRCLID